MINVVSNVIRSLLHGLGFQMRGLIDPDVVEGLPTFDSDFDRIA
jgi:hypothetical protein